MKKPDKYIYDLIIEHLTGKMTQKDRAVLNEWIKSAPGNKNLVEKIEHIYATDSTTAKTDNESWQKLEYLLKERWLYERKNRLYRFTIAAGLVLMVGVATLIFRQNNHYLTLTTELNEYRKDTLANGSLIFLYPSSELKIDKRNQKPVALKGEAFFMIAPQKENPVTINAKGLFVKVKGTSFRINAPEKSTNVSVLVEEGTVEISEQEKPQQSLLVYAGEEGYYSKTNKQIWKQTKSSNIYLIYQPGH